MSTRPLRVVVSGMVAGVPHHGGASWAVLQYVLGLRRLGHEVVLLEQCPADSLLPARSTLEASTSAAYFHELVAAFGLQSSAALLVEGSSETLGLPYERLRELAGRADLLVNISGTLTDEALTEGIPTRAYLDLDPAFNQLWHEAGIDMRFEGHTHFVTVGQAIGAPDCTVPDCSRDWIPTLPPVVLEHWPRAEGLVTDAYTTVGNWRGYGSIEHEGVRYGQKAHSMRDFMELPARTRARFVLALDLHPDEKSDLEALALNGWTLVDPIDVAGTPARYREFLAGSRGEFGIAKHGYVASRCGWFSDRSACYLACGRPVLAQETGWSRFLPSGDGLLAFETPDDVVSGIEQFERDPRRHAAAARALAERWLDSDRVLPALLERLGLA